MKKAKNLAMLGISFLAAYSVPFAFLINEKVHSNFVVFSANGQTKKMDNDDLDYLLSGENAEENANLLELGFYKNAIYGFDFDDANDSSLQTNPTDNSIMGEYPGFFNDVNGVYNVLHQTYTLINIDYQIKSQNTNLTSYLANIAIEDKSIAEDLYLTISEGYETVADWVNAMSGSVLEEQLINLSNNSAFQAIDTSLNNDLEANKFILEALYLLQPSSNKNYDYRLTEKLKTQKNMLTWEANLTNVNNLAPQQANAYSFFNNNPAYDSLEKIEANYKSGANPDVLSTDFDVEDDNVMLGDIGFKGMQTTDSIAFTEDEMSDYENSWKVNDTYNPTTGGWTTIQKSDYTSFATGTLGTFVLDDTDNKILKTGVNSEGKILKVVSFYPFYFAKNYQPTDQSSDQFYYSIEAGYDTVNDEYYKVEPNTAEAVNLVDAIMFNNDNTGNKVTSYLLDSYLLYYTIQHDSNTLLNSQVFWKNRNYYIEFNGEMKTIYGDLVDQGIQKLS